MGLTMSETKAPGWLRTFDIVFGLIAVVLSVVVLVYQELAILTMIAVLSVVLLVTGIARIFGGIFSKHLSDVMRALNFGVGIVAIVLGLVALLYPNITTQLLIYIISFALLLNGVARLLCARVTFPVDPKEQHIITTEITEDIIRMFNEHPEKVRFPMGRSR